MDDGSTDGTSQLCERLVTSDQRIICVHKENGGVSSARNCGIDVARGEYIMFVDSDDWIESNALETMYKVAVEYGAEIVLPRCVGEFYSAYGTHEKSVYDPDDFECIVYRNALASEFEKLWDASCCFSVCGRLFSRCMIVQNGIRFNRHVHVLEDMCFLLASMHNMVITVHVNNVIYHYTVVDQSSYSGKRDPWLFLRSLPKVQHDLLGFLERDGMGRHVRYIDFLMGYWILSLESLKKREKNLRKLVSGFRMAIAEIERDDIYSDCTKANVKTEYRVLFETKSIAASLAVDKAKSMRDAVLKVFKKSLKL